MVTKMVRGLEAKSYEEWIKELSMFSITNEEKTEGRLDSSFQFMKWCHMEEAINLFSIR